MTAGAVGGDIAVQVMAWLLKKRRMEAAQDSMTGRYLLPYSKPYRVITLLTGAVLGGFFVLGALLCDDAKSWAIYGSVFGALSLISLYLIYDVFQLQLSFAEDGIYREGGFGGSAVFLPWSSVTGVNYSESGYSFSFKGADGQKIRISVYRDGLGTLAQFAGRRLTSGPAQNAQALLQQKGLAA